MRSTLNLRLSPTELLHSLHRLRWLALLAACLLMTSLIALFDVTSNQAGMFSLLAALALWNSLLWLRLRSSWPATELELTLQLLVDTGFVFALLLCTGGGASPFVSLYLLPIALAAASLPPGLAWVVLLAAASSYSGLLWLAPPSAHALHGGFSLHILGMWVTFIIAAVLLVSFVSAMAMAVRRRDESLTQTREKMLRNEQISALGVLAAGTAHELGTPLSTISTLLGDIRQKAAGDDELEQDLNQIDQQVRLCSARLAQMLDSAERSALSDPDNSSLPLSDWLQATLDRWRLLRPWIHAHIELADSLPVLTVTPDAGLAQTLINLLNNAADASAANGAKSIHFSASREQNDLLLAIEDEGAGICASDRAQAGRVRFSRKPQGQGLGLLLSHASLDRLDGQLQLSQRPQGGTATTLRIPVRALAPSFP